MLHAQTSARARQAGIILKEVAMLFGLVVRGRAWALGGRAELGDAILELLGRDMRLENQQVGTSQARSWAD